MLKRMLASAGLMILIAGCGQSMKDLGGAPNPNLSDGDNAWFKKITVSNMTEIQSSQLALTQSQNGSVKEFAQKMIDDHNMAGNQVMKLAADKQVTLPTQLDDKHQDMIDKLKGKTGSDFDKAYLDLQVMAHKETISFDQDEANNGTDPQVKVQADELLPTLKMHLMMAQKLSDGQSGM